MEIIPLGAGCEVGRSCVIMRFKGSTIMFDCGVHPAFNGLAALPYFDEFDLSEVDLLLVTHFHLDHCGALPYVTEKTNFNGRIFMTHATKAIYKIILNDYVRVTSGEEKLYDEKDLVRSMEKIELIDYHQVVTHKGVRFTALNAGHVLGAAMFNVEVAGVRTLYTGDFSCQEDRHLRGAEQPTENPHVLIVESTYGVQRHGPADVRESRFTSFVHKVVARGGRCLIPVFALGRAQELLLILDEYWRLHPELHSVPVYYASSLAKKCMKVYLAYINMMNDHIRKAHELANPWKFKHITELKSMSGFDDSQPVVVMASPGMLQSGLSRELFERWCSDKRNGLMMPGYTVAGTLGHHVMSEPQEITTQAGETVPVALSIEYISFSAHSDYAQTSGFIDATKPKHVVLVHGAEEEMRRLKGALVHKFGRDKSGRDRLDVLMPRNCHTVQISFHAHKVAKAIGNFAAAQPAEGGNVSALLVRRDFGYELLAESDLGEHTGLQAVSIMQRPRLPFHGDSAMLRAALEQLFPLTDAAAIGDAPMGGDAARGEEQELHVYVAGAVNVRVSEAQRQAQLEWASSAANDLVADAVASVVLRLETEAMVARACAAPAAPLPAPTAPAVKREEVVKEDDDVKDEPDAPRMKRPR